MVKYTFKDWQDLTGVKLIIFLGWMIPRTTEQIAKNVLGRKSHSTTDIINLRDKLYNKDYLKKISYDEMFHKFGKLEPNAQYYQTTKKAFLDFLESLNQYLRWSPFERIRLTKKEINQLNELYFEKLKITKISLPKIKKDVDKIFNKLDNQHTPKNQLKMEKNFFYLVLDKVIEELKYVFFDSRIIDKLKIKNPKHYKKELVRLSKKLSNYSLMRTNEFIKFKRLLTFRLMSHKRVY